MANGLAPHINLWVTHGEEVVLSGWRIDLLEAIAATGSISAAADQLQVNYRVAWNKIKEMEHGLGVALLETHIGGSHGGGAELTPAALEFIQRYHLLSAGLDEWVQRRFTEVFGSTVI